MGMRWYYRIDTSLFMQRFVLQSGVFERINLGTLCLYLLCLFKISDLDHQQISKWILGGVLTFALTTLGSWHYAMFLLLASMFIGIWMVVKHQNRMIMRHLLLLAAGCAIVAIPISQRAQTSLSNDTIIEHKAHTLWDWKSQIEMLNDVMDRSSSKHQIPQGLTF